MCIPTHTREEVRFGPQIPLFSVKIFGKYSRGNVRDDVQNDVFYHFGKTNQVIGKAGRAERIYLIGAGPSQSGNDIILNIASYRDTHILGTSTAYQALYMSACVNSRSLCYFLKCGLLSTLPGSRLASFSLALCEEFPRESCLSLWCRSRLKCSDAI